MDSLFDKCLVPERAAFHVVLFADAICGRFVNLIFRGVGESVFEL